MTAICNTNIMQYPLNETNEKTYMDNADIKKKPSFADKIKSLFGQIDLTQGSIIKVIVKFTLPIIVSYLLQQLYILSDAAICGQTLSADEVAGVNDTSPLVFIFMQFAFGCTAGFCVVLSSKFGSHDEAGARKSFATQFILCGIITVILTLVSVFCIKPMLAWVNVTEQNPVVFQAAYTYCLVIFLGIIAQLFYNFIISILRSIGDSFTPLLFLLVSTAMNIALDLLFIKVFGWGVAGAAGATILTQVLCTIACFVYTFVKYKFLRLKKEDFKIAWSDIWAHVKQGIPLGLQFSVLSVGLIVMLSETIKFDLLPDGLMVAGNPAQNGVGAANKLINFAMAPLSALGTAMVSFNAQNLGAGLTERVKKGTNQAILLGFALTVICAGIGLLLTVNGAYQHVFLSADKISEKSLYFGNTFLYIDLPLFFFLSTLFVLRNAVQGIGKSGWTLAAGAGELIARVLICTFVPALVNGGPTNALASNAAYIALCFGDPGAWVFAVAVLIYPYIKHIVKKDYRYALGESTSAEEHKLESNSSQSDSTQSDVVFDLSENASSHQNVSSQPLSSDDSSGADCPPNTNND